MTVEKQRTSQIGRRRHVVSDATQSSSDATRASDWMAERIHGSARAHRNEQAVTIDKPHLSRGRAKESRRGQQ
jgi:hypothetical protein